jgi:erythronate-4-phosphate dehydrogenase
LKLIVDENIAYAKEAFSQFGIVSLLNGRNITKDILNNADIVIVRSITNVNEKLLRGTKVKFVGTATIGTDHIDADYLQKKNISFADAKGCNADSVAEYFLTALLKIVNDNKISIKNKSVGVIGVGNVGTRVANYAQVLGFNVLKNDPPKERAGIGSGYVSLDDALQADIISLHVPLNKAGIDKTVHLFDEEKLNRIKNGAILINTSRGAVIDNNALLNIIDKKNISVCLDVWEGEPEINTKLLEKVNIGTAHIAGYSLEGKLNGTKMIYNALCKFTGQNSTWNPVLPQIESDTISISPTGTLAERLYYLFKQVYNIVNDDLKMRKMLEMDDNSRVYHFDKLRKEYPLRRELNNYSVALNNNEKSLSSILSSLRFNVKCVT